MKNNHRHHITQAPHNTDLPATGPASASCTFYRTEIDRIAIATYENLTYFDIDGNTSTHMILTNTSNNEGDFATLDYEQGALCWTLAESQGEWALM